MPNSEFKQDLDGGFIGFESRTNPTLLKQQYLQLAQNLRLERGVAQTRKGAKNFTSADISNKPIYASSKYVDTSGQESIALVSNDSLYIYNVSGAGSVTQYLYPTGRTISSTDKCDIFQGIDSLFIVRGEPEALKTATFNTTNGSKIITVNCTAHGYIVGDEVIISGSAITDSNEKGSFIVVTKTTDQFTVLAVNNASGNHTNSGQVQRGKAPFVFNNGSVSLVAQGVIEGTTSNFPPCNTGMFYGNRVIIKRDDDKIAVSDFLDYNQWDLTFGQFTINLGAYDKIVGFTPWADNEFLIFERNSIYRARIENETYLASSSPDTTSYIATVTTAFGCVGPKAIVNAGRFIFFLSDNGIYMLEPQLDLRLINAIEPLSAPINDIINTIDKTVSDKSCGIYHNNRLYMAVPRTNLGNDTVLIFNTLNKAWESIDIYPNDTVYGGGQFVIKNFIEATYGNKKRLFCVSNLGLYLLEENTDGDEVGSFTGVILPKTLPFSLTSDVSKFPIQMLMKTRKFTYGTTQEKRYSSAAVEFEFETNSSTKITANVYNPDVHEIIDFFNGVGPQDYVRRNGIGKRGFACDLIIEGLSGRPIIKSVSVDANLSGRLTKSES